MQIMQWIESDPPNNRKMPKWMRQAAVVDNGEVFLPLACVGNEMVVFLCISFDGIPVLRDKGHIYGPASWLQQEYPQYRDKLKTLVDRINVFIKS